MTSQCGAYVLFAEEKDKAKMYVPVSLVFPNLAMAEEVIGQINGPGSRIDRCLAEVIISHIKGGCCRGNQLRMPHEIIGSGQPKDGSHAQFRMALEIVGECGSAGHRDDSIL